MISVSIYCRTVAIFIKNKSRINRFELYRMIKEYKDYMNVSTNV